MSLSTALTTLMGIIALIILGVDLLIRRKILKTELEFKEKKFEMDKQERSEWQNWLERERLHLGKLSKPLAEELFKEFKKDYEWAVTALEKAKLGPYSETLFGDRSGHFREEKELLSEKFIPLLLNRCKFLSKNLNKHVYILIDSGTTLFPLFKLIGKETVRAHENNETWVKNLTVVTNNLPGLQALMEVGRPNPNNRYADLAISCKLLPGAPLPIYSAVTGEETEKYLQELKQEATESSDPVFISIVTGNWIRIRETDPRCPVPLARGNGHLPFKQKLVDISDETYVISPLGKIFANASNDNVNKLLRLNKGAIDPEKRNYDELKIIENAGRVKLVSTRRKDGRVLQNLSRYISGNLQISERINEEEFINAPIGKTNHLLFKFDKLPKEKYLEMDVEFPHTHTRREDFISFFKHPESGINF